MFNQIVTQPNALNPRCLSLDGLHEAPSGAKLVRAALDALEAWLLTAAVDRTFDPANRDCYLIGAAEPSQTIPDPQPWFEMHAPEPVGLRNLVPWVQAQTNSPPSETARRCDTVESAIVGAEICRAERG